MRVFTIGGVTCLVLLTGSLRAEAPPSPTRLIPAEADVLIEVPHPRNLVETFTHLDTLKQLQELAPVKELLSSTQYRRFYQLTAYFEKELGAGWPELLDQFAGGGIALGVKLGPNPAPALLVIQGKDEESMRKFVKLALAVIEDELARQESKETPVKNKYQDIETISVGKEFHAAQVGSTLLIANKEEALKAGLDLHTGKAKKSLAESKAVADAKKLLPQNPMATLWLNMETVRKSPQAADFYKTPRDPTLEVAFGHYVDLLSRTPYVSVGFYKEKDGFRTAIRMPRGRDGMGDNHALHTPEAGKPGTRPLLEPKGVLYSESFYLDVSRIWLDREKLFGKDVAKSMEEGDKNSGRVLSGLSVSKLLTQAGAHHRVVVVNQPKTGYKATTKQPIPAFAVVTEMRDPEAFGKSMNTVLRGAALLATTQFQLRLTEEKHGDVEIVGYRFPEDKPLKQDVNDLRFNFSPCFCRVGDQFVFCSTLELCHELVGLLEKEAKSGAKGAPAISHFRIYSKGLAELAQGFEDLLVTQAILDQAIPLEDARTQAKAAISLLRGLGMLDAELRITEKEFRYDIRTKSAK